MSADLVGVGSNVSRHLGRRGAILMLLGLVWVFIGLSNITEQAVPGTEAMFFGKIPELIRFLGWVLTGVVAMIWAWVPPRRSDAAGFLALYLVPGVRALSYFWGWLDSLDGQGGYSRGWVGATIYVAFMGIIAVVAGWPEPPTREVTSKAAS